MTAVRFRISALLALTLSSLPATVCAQVFQNPYRIPTPTDPYQIASGDLNGDGTTDFIWPEGEFGSATLHVLLSQPTGEWIPGASFPGPTNSGITSCVLVDVNLDKNLDLVCSGSYQFTAYAHVFFGNGDGTFQPPITTQIHLNSSGGYADALLASEGDLNGDGLPDFFYEDRTTFGGYILLSDGKGGFKAPLPLNSSSMNDVIPVAADVNGDGIPDLLFPQGPEVALGNGDGTFGTIVNYEQPSYYLATCIFHDMDGDGHLDAVCGYAETITGDITGATDLIILHGNPDGSFNTTPISQTRFGDFNNEYDGFGTFQAPLYVADVNGDGILDVLGYSGDGLAVLFGGPKLTYSKLLHYAVGVIEPLTYGAYSLGQGQVLDVNGDGHPDVVAIGPNGIYISYGKPDGTFGAPFAPEVAEVIGYFTVADFNGDGIPDIAATGDTAIKLSLGKGDGTYFAPVALNNQNGAINFSVSVDTFIVRGDFNGDGKVDLMAIGSPGGNNYGYSLFLGNGDGTFQNPLSVTPPSFPFGTRISLSDNAVYDVNKDGRSDIIYGSDTTVAPTQSQITVTLSKGDGTFTNVVSIVPSDLSQNVFYTMILPALADFSGDGKLDAAYGSLNHVYVLKGHGDGSFDTTGTSLSIPSMTGLSNNGALANVAADFDGDGNQDIAVLEEYVVPVYPYINYSTAVWVYFGNGDGTFSSPVLAGQFDRDYTNVAASDLAGNGRSDLILSNGGSLGGYAVGILSSLPGRTFGPEVNYFAGTGLSSLEIADVNRDGRPDLIFGNNNSNLRASSVTELINLGPAPQLTGTLFALPEPSVVAQAFKLTATLSPPSPATLSGNVAFQVDGVPAGSALLSANTALLPLAGNLSIGQHMISASWPGDTTYQSVTLLGTHNVIAAPTNATITSSQDPALVGTNITFTATVTSSYGTPAGSVALSDGGTALGIINLTNGSGTYSTSGLTVGTHNIGASYAANGNFAAGSASLSQVIQGQPSTTTLTGAPNPASVDGAVNLTATVTAATGTPTGTVRFYDGGALLGTATMSGGAAAISTAFTSAGTHNLTANYSGDASYSPGTGAFAETVNLNPTSMTASALPSPSIAFQPTVFGATVKAPAGIIPTGTVIFTANGSQIGSGTLQNGSTAFSTSALTAGSYTIVASYAGDSVSGPSSAAPFTLVVAQQSSQVHLASSLNPAPLGANVTFTAAVSVAQTFSGTVQFRDGATALNSPVTLNAQGTATYTTSALALGNHNITAQYSGDASTFSSVSAALQQTIVPYAGDFSIAVTPTARSLYTGESSSLQVTVASIGGFNQPLSLSCGNLPAATTCSFSTSSLPNGQGTATVVIQTSASQQVSAKGAAGSGLHGGPGGAGEWTLAFLTLFFVPRKWRRGCSAPNPIVGGTPPGTYQISITGAYTAPAPPLVHSATASLTVKSLF